MGAMPVRRNRPAQKKPAGTSVPASQRVLVASLGENTGCMEGRHHHSSIYRVAVGSGQREYRAPDLMPGFYKLCFNVCGFAGQPWHDIRARQRPQD